MKKKYIMVLTEQEGVYLSNLLHEEATSRRFTIEESAWRRDLADRLHPANHRNAPMEPVAVLEGRVDDVDVEDGGQAKIGHISEINDVGEGFFVKLHSWSERKEHKIIDAIKGSRVRVTVEKEVE